MPGIDQSEQEEGMLLRPQIITLASLYKDNIFKLIELMRHPFLVNLFACFQTPVSATRVLFGPQICILTLPSQPICVVAVV